LIFTYSLANGNAYRLSGTEDNYRLFSTVILISPLEQCIITDFLATGVLTYSLAQRIVKSLFGTMILIIFLALGKITNGS
jgi:hypothetical protein